MKQQPPFLLLFCSSCGEDMEASDAEIEEEIVPPSKVDILDSSVSGHFYGSVILTRSTCSSCKLKTLCFGCIFTIIIHIKIFSTEDHNDGE